MCLWVGCKSQFASVSLETKVCLWASITLAHESRHLLEGGKKSPLSFSFFQGNTLNQHPGYKFAKCNTGLIVCWVDVGCIRIDPSLSPPSNKTATSSFSSSSSPAAHHQNLSFLMRQKWEKCLWVEKTFCDSITFHWMVVELSSNKYWWPRWGVSDSNIS